MILFESPRNVSGRICVCEANGSWYCSWIMKWWIVVKHFHAWNLCQGEGSVLLD